MSAPERHDRWTRERGHRPVRIANCSGARTDPGIHMFRQATLGDVDFITGDYLAEANLAENAEAMAAGKHEGFEPTAWDGLQQTMETLDVKRIKVIINGGALNPMGLAKKCHALIADKGYDLKVAAVTGDNLLPEVQNHVKASGELPHLDSTNSNVRLAQSTDAYLKSTDHPLVSANAYLGARGIIKGLELGADIIICGRVADASPVIGASQWWHSWSDTSYDALAGGLTAGHLIECSTYITGANFAGFEQYDPDDLIDVGLPIAEVAANGTCVVTKHEDTKGIVTEDTVKCQFLYELQGNIYLNSDVKSYLDNVVVTQVGKNRVEVSGIRGAPPPPTTKLAVFYRGGFESQLLLNATGYATKQKWILYEKQLRWALSQKGVINNFDILEFQIVGTNQPNPPSQLKSTTYCRIFAQALTPTPLLALLQSMSENVMQHFSGWHASLDLRTTLPRPFLAYYPALYRQDDLHEKVHLILPDGSHDSTNAGHPPRYEPLEERANYDTPLQQSTPENVPPDWGPTKLIPLGDIALARSGDKGSNVNLGIFICNAGGSGGGDRGGSAIMWQWFRHFMTRKKLQELIGEEDWKEGEYFIERVEFARIRAVHFVVYGLLGRGVSGSTLLDSLGKGFADYVRDKWVDVPERFLGGGDRDG